MNDAAKQIVITRSHLRQLIVRKANQTGKVLLVFGPRQAGKSTLLRSIFPPTPSQVMWLNGDDADSRELFRAASATRMRMVVGAHTTLVIDEAQRIENIGLALKIIADNMPGVNVIATGSSAFELANKTQEPLTGRKKEMMLYPFCYSELVAHFGLLEERRMLGERLVYGAYPEVVMAASTGTQREVLRELVTSYLYKDVLQIEEIRRPDLLQKLLEALARQLGNEVSTHELAQRIGGGVDTKTVDKYIGLLEQAFVVFRLGALSRNLRSEIAKKKKIYFYDNGVRNALIADYRPIELRNDVGALWENYLMAERVKYNSYTESWVKPYFWRTRTQQEIDYIEERDSDFTAYEFKWSAKKQRKLPYAFGEAYGADVLHSIHPDNYEGFLELPALE